MLRVTLYFLATICACVATLLIFGTLSRGIELSFPGLVLNTVLHVILLFMLYHKTADAAR